LGYQSLRLNTEGLRNTALGYRAGDVITTGSDNTIIGYGADPSAVDASNQIVIGKLATGQGNNYAVIGNADVERVYASQDGQATVYAGGMVLEGSTADANETTLGLVDPTADRTINLPNQSGTLPVLAAASATAITSTPEELNILDGVTSNATELNILDASAINSVSSDGASSNGDFTSNNYKISHTFTLDGNLADGAAYANSITITNNKVLLTSVILATASVDVRIDVHSVTSGSFKVRITNKSGAQLNNDSTIIINYIVL
jgi:hypothetical protein